jgi:hypothetical protein
LPEADLVQITVVGTAIGIGPPIKPIARNRRHTGIYSHILGKYCYLN